LRSLFSEDLFADGVAQKLHYVVKNAAFTVNVDGVGSLETMNFAKAKTTLLLQYSESLATVSLPSSKPAVTYICHPEVGTASLDTRVQILSSSAEGKYFVLRADVAFPNQEPFTVTSDPIRCVSKLEQVRRKINLAMGSTNNKKKATSNLDDDEADWDDDDGAAIPALKKRKRASTEELYASLAALKQNQEMMLEMLKKQASERVIKIEQMDEEWSSPYQPPVATSKRGNGGAPFAKRAKRTEGADVGKHPHVVLMPSQRGAGEDALPSSSSSGPSVEVAFLSLLQRFSSMSTTAREHSLAHLTKSIEQSPHLRVAFQELAVPLLEQTVQPSNGRCVFKACPSAMLANQVGMIMQDITLASHQQDPNRMDEDDSISSYTDDAHITDSVVPTPDTDSGALVHGRSGLLSSCNFSGYPAAWTEADPSALGDASDLLF
jgi:hypothetical protein